MTLLSSATTAALRITTPKTLITTRDHALRPATTSKRHGTTSFTRLLRARSNSNDAKTDKSI
jgi:hypothetical protein